MQFGIRCPRCKSRLGYMVAYSVDVFKFALAKKFKFCPFCGVDLDIEVKDTDFSAS
jgi:rRNA maturation endonuclease Nob1